MKDFIIDDRDGRRIVARTVNDMEVFGAIEDGDWKELARRPLPLPTDEEDLTPEAGSAIGGDVPVATYQISPDVMYVTDGPSPSPERLRELMKKHGLTGSKVAEIVGVNSRTVRKWTGGERGIPEPAWRLLLYWIRAMTREDGEHDGWRPQ